MLSYLASLTAGLMGFAGHPAMLAQAAEAPAAAPTAYAEPLDAHDPFASLSSMEMDDLRSAAGGTAINELDLQTVGLNISDTDGSVSGTTVTDSQTGTVDNTYVSGNTGITTVFVNTGNGVVFQNTLQVNVYAPLGN
jgi:hypothetical protein